MDEVARYNIERWAALVKANALFTRPHLDLDADTARQRVDPDGMFGDLSGRDVLLLGGGGGQQSSAFALLGACVTVVDIAQGQLEGDQQAAEHYGLTITTQQGDMRDLSALGDARFDLVYQPYSLNFVPDAHEVFTQVGVCCVLVGCTT
ncbi:MAG: class I SAM-dependent methyltransferase [Anaerolineae bacterium]|nr:class I SAM-dependent methyltransferase [Anaerolineae bacterium]